jgi:hypothetical protein
MCLNETYTKDCIGICWRYFLLRMVWRDAFPPLVFRFALEYIIGKAPLDFGSSHIKTERVTPSSVCAVDV